MVPSDPASGARTRALLDRCAEGEGAAWEEFRSRWGAFLSSAARRALGASGRASGADVEECVAEVHARLLADGGARLREYRPEFSPATWLSFVVLGVVRDHRRSGLRTPPAPQGAIEGRLAADLAPPERAVGEEAMARLRNAVAGLGARDRILLRLRYEQDLGIAAVARVMHLTEGGVAQALQRCRNRLRDCLLEEGD